MHSSYGDRQVETAGSGAPRVEVEHPFTDLIGWPMRVPEDHGCESRCPWVKVKLRQLVHYIEEVLANLDYFGCREGISPRALVAVSSDRERRCKFAKVLKHLGLSDIPAVDNQIADLEGNKYLGSNQTVRVRDHPYADSAIGHGTLQAA